MFTEHEQRQHRRGGARVGPRQEKTLRETFSHGWILYTLFGVVVKIFLVKTYATLGSDKMTDNFGRPKPQPFPEAEENFTRFMREREMGLVFLRAFNIV